MKVRHVDLHADEFLAAVVGEMTPAELGVYWMICLLCYSRGGNIPHDLDWLRAKFGRDGGNRIVSPIVEKLIASGKVRRAGAELYVSCVRAELELTLSRMRAAVEDGRRGGRPRKHINGLEKPPPFSDEKPTTNHQPLTTNNSIDKPNGLSPPSASGRRRKSLADYEPEFEEFWQACPAWKRVEKKAAHNEWKRIRSSGVTNERLVAAMRRYAESKAGEDPHYTIHPKRWLKNGRWEDEEEIINGYRLDRPTGPPPPLLAIVGE